MASRKEEERNEKIIRGLMKLPPNRKCINCNSLGPQYVCTTFWTFVCMACSGIHREFTHRVKSVSMAKFTSQEVEALQNGGNQRARELYLKDWDTQRQRLPDSSNANKVRDFIKNVYVDKRYAGGKSSDKPPRDGQSPRSPEDETRRASSYHSYSQSPPYDSQYEDRRYGKQSAVLARKPGSDRGLDGKVSRWFSNDGSGSRVSDYSVSSGGSRSPNYQNVGFSSPPIHRSRNMSSEDVLPQSINSFSEANTKRVPDGNPHPQRVTSFGSFGSFDSNSMSLNSFNSSSLVDVSESEQNPGACQDKMSAFPRSSVLASPSDIDLFKAPALQQLVSSGPSSISLFHQPATSSVPVDLFQPSLVLQAQPVNILHPPLTSSPSSFDFFTQQQPAVSAATTNTIPAELSVPKNDGWATFDIHPATIISFPESLATAKVSNRDEGSLGQFDPFSSFDSGTQWPSIRHSGAHESSSMSNPWHGGIDCVQVPDIVKHTESWNAFEDSRGYFPLEVAKQSKEPVAGLNLSSAIDQHLNDIDRDDIQRAAPFDQYLNNIDKAGTERAAPYDGKRISVVNSQVTGPSYVPQGEIPSHSADHKSTNPFDIPYDSELEQSNLFLDMSSLQAVLPNAQLAPLFPGDVTESWFPENPVTPYIPAVPHGGFAHVAAHAPNSPVQNVPTQGPVASVGGNPFA